MSLATARRLEELALNASGAPHSLVYDGWLLGYRPGPTKRLRCVNPFYRSTLPLVEKVDYCTAFYAAAGLPAIFRMLPFCEPPELEALLERMGWAPFERTLVLRTDLSHASAPALPADTVDILPLAEWIEATARLLEADAEALPRLLEHAQTYPLPQAGALIRRDGQAVACGLVKLEGGYAGLFVVHTSPELRGQGLARAIIAALLDESRRLGVRQAYLQVTASNAAALSLYDRFGFATAYEYWYRARCGEQH